MADGGVGTLVGIGNTFPVWKSVNVQLINGSDDGGVKLVKDIGGTDG